jgi:hypothetical protein
MNSLKITHFNKLFLVSALGLLSFVLTNQAIIEDGKAIADTITITNDTNETVKAGSKEFPAGEGVVIANYFATQKGRNRVPRMVGSKKAVLVYPTPKMSATKRLDVNLPIHLSLSDLLAGKKNEYRVRIR